MIGALILVEVKKGKEGMKIIKYYLHLKVTTACTKRTTEATKGIG